MNNKKITYKSQTTFSKIGTALVSGEIVCGTFTDPDFFNGMTCLHVYAYRKNVLLSLIFFPNKDLQLVSISNPSAEECFNEVAKEIINENTKILVDSNHKIDLKSAIVPDTQNSKIYWKLID